MMSVLLSMGEIGLYVSPIASTATIYYIHFIIFVCITNVSVCYSSKKVYLILFIPIFEIAVLLITVCFPTYCTFLLSKVAVLLSMVIPFTDGTITHARTIILSMTYLVTFETFERSFAFCSVYCLEGYTFLFFGYHFDLCFL
jgi:hypothetical protein